MNRPYHTISRCVIQKKSHIVLIGCFDNRLGKAFLGRFRNANAKLSDAPRFWGVLINEYQSFAEKTSFKPRIIFSRERVFGKKNPSLYFGEKRMLAGKA